MDYDPRDYEDNADCPVSLNSPIEMFLNVRDLIDNLERELKTIAANRAEDGEETKEQREYAEKQIRLRRMFIQWLKNNPEDTVYTRLAVVSELEEDGDTGMLDIGEVEGSLFQPLLPMQRGIVH